MSTPDLKRNTSSNHAYSPPGYGSHPLHIFLVLTGLLGHIHPLALAPAWLALAAIACWPWGALRLPVAILSMIFTLADGVGLALLPRMRRSFGPVTPPLLALALIHTTIAFAAGLLWKSAQLSPSAPLRTGAHGDAWPGLLLTAVLDFAISAVFFYATWMEPFRIEVTQAELRSPKLNGHAPLRLLHITDLHVERITAREEKLLRLVEELAPDVIVLTGDYLNLSSVYDVCAQAEARDLLAQLCDIARSPVYAITGSPPVDRSDVVPAIFQDLPITWLLDTVEELHINGHTIRLAGLRCTRERHLDVPRLRRLLCGSLEHQFTVLLYHSPDLMPEATESGVDLYLCGHTHGGQIRLPFFGAIITSSDFWKRYEMGRYEEGSTTLYVSRGLGMEGLGAPRARFLAPPEIVLWTLSS
jgi:predicted MPP superfamily phosphohydrolase